MFIFAVEDRGDELALLWTQEMEGRVEASLSRDPRGGLWGWAIPYPSLRRWDELDGTELDVLDVDDLIGDPADQHWPSSAVTIAGDASRPVLMVMAKPLALGDNHVVALDLAAGRLLWRYDFLVEPSLFTAPQYAIVEGDQGPVVVFPTYFNGARGIGLE